MAAGRSLGENDFHRDRGGGPKFSPRPTPVGHELIREAHQLRVRTRAYGETSGTRAAVRAGIRAFHLGPPMNDVAVAGFLIDP